MTLRSCLKPPGHFVVGIHDPSYYVKNVRHSSFCRVLGHTPDGSPVVNDVNFPGGDFFVNSAEKVYEIHNVFPCWGATYILSKSAESIASKPGSWEFKRKWPDENFHIIKDLVKHGLKSKDGNTYNLNDLPRSLKIAIARRCDDSEILEAMASSICKIELDSNNKAVGIGFEEFQSSRRPNIADYELFKALVANPYLPDDYKRAMILMPGIQGGNPIVGEYRKEKSHAWEYLRANSYIPWGHYASNMAHDSVRYNVRDLSFEDLKGLRHLYYQRILIRMETSLSETLNDPGIVQTTSNPSDQITVHELDGLRERVKKNISKVLETGHKLPFNSTLWGWNYGFDSSQSGYRLHASNQQIHQQFALIPSTTEIFPSDKNYNNNQFTSYAAGDHVSEFAEAYRYKYKRSFFDDYITAIKSNRRTDGRKDLEASLVIHEDENAMLFVPKAQRSQAEIQIIAQKEIASIIYADRKARESIDYMIWLAVRLLSLAGAEMITCCEMSGRFDKNGSDQRLMYYFLPRHPSSPGSFSEHQGRWITGHFPEDVALTLRRKLQWL